MAEFPIDKSGGSEPPRTIISDLSVQMFGAHTYRREERLVVNIAQSILVMGNPNRIAMLLVNNSEGEVYLSFDPDVSTVRGMILGANGGSLSMTFRNDGELIGDAIYGVGSGDNLNVTLFETLVQETP